MQVLVAAASRHGSTSEIAQTIAEDLRGQGIDAEYRDCSDVSSVDGYQAFVLGSAVYMGRWLREAHAFLEQHRNDLSTRPVWLFSSGPLGTDKDETAMTEEMVQELTNLVGARGHQTFAGKLEHDELSRAERLVVRVVHAPLGDFRDWGAVHDWAKEIVLTLADDAEKVAYLPNHIVTAAQAE